MTPAVPAIPEWAWLAGIVAILVAALLLRRGDRPRDGDDR